MKATAKDLRTRSKEILDAVGRGEEVTITYRGKPYAKLVPVRKEIPKYKENALFGLWKDNESVEDVDAYLDELRRSRF
jgi:prevent-host-death family protein